MGINGKTTRLLNRLPHFYSPEELKSTFLGLYQVLGDSLEICERDIFRVLKAHHVQTAENVGSKGYIAPPEDHGDLDKLYSLYLEALGGTSQLIGMNPLFSNRSFDVERLLTTIYEENNSPYTTVKSIWIDETTESDPDEIENYLVSSLKFKESEISSDFVFALLVRDSSFSEYLANQLSESTLKLLYTYDGKGSISSEIKKVLAEELNRKILKDPFLFQKNYKFFKDEELDENTISLRNSLNKKFLQLQFEKDFEEDPEIFDNSRLNLEKAIKDLELSEPPSRPMMNDLQRFNRMLLDYVSSTKFKEYEIDHHFISSLQQEDNNFIKYIVKQLSKPTYSLLFAYDGKEDVLPTLKKALVKELNQNILNDPLLFQKNYTFFKNKELDKKTISLRNLLNKEFLKLQYEKQFEENPESFGNSKENLEKAIKELDSSEPSARPMINDLQLFSRILVDYVLNPTNGTQQQPEYLWAFEERQIPSRSRVRNLLQGRLNYLLQSDGEETEIFFSHLLSINEDANDLVKLYKDDEKMLRRFLLESIFPYEVKHIYRIYQERLHALIQVLRKGASTKQGIIDIVAANFGLISDEPEAIKAKELIQIKEYDPKEEHFFNKNVALYKPFSVTNSNETEAFPKVKITLLKAQFKGISNLTFFEISAGLKTGNSFSIDIEMRINDTLQLLPDGTVVFNGVYSSRKIDGSAFSLSPGNTHTWQIEAKILSSDEKTFGSFGRFDVTNFDDAVLISEEECLKVEVLTDKLTFGAFTIVIPWHIKGITDRFAEGKDHPRHKIKSLVENVKAAGIKLSVSYLYDCEETHELNDRFDISLRGKQLQEAHEINDSFSNNSQLILNEKHELTDLIKTSGIFDYTKFDSANGFE